MQHAREHGRTLAREELVLDQRLDDGPTGVNITDVGCVVQVPNSMSRPAAPHLDTRMFRLRMNVHEAPSWAERPMQGA
jgi:hypothetical protein